MGKINFTTAKTREDIAAILALQRVNHVKQLDAATIKSQGFITFEYSLEPLWAMNQNFPSIVAWGEPGELAGYCLSGCSTDRGHFGALDDMYAYFETLEFAGKKLGGAPFMCNGQVCVAENFRGQGVFDGMYLAFKELWSPQFDCCVTEISQRNTRSLRAHQRLGFEVFHEYSDGIFNETWDVVGWDWNTD